jgi:hypothetical protein
MRRTRGYTQKIKGTIAFFMCLALLHSLTKTVDADPFLYSDLEIVLKLSVHEKGIDGETLNAHKVYLLKFLNAVHSLEKTEYETWSRNEKLAFWLNMYNACSLSLLLKYPYAEKITDIPESPRDMIFSVFGENMSLSQIKHIYLRGYFQDERIHCALATPARGFPSMRNEAYLGIYVNLQLEEDVMRFITDPEHVRVDTEKKKIVLSKVFEWTAIDFVKRYQNDIPELRKFNLRERAVLRFLSHYLTAEEDFILSGDYTLDYFDFDWTIVRKSLKGARS